MRKIPFAGIELTSQRVRGYMVPLSYLGDGEMFCLGMVSTNLYVMLFYEGEIQNSNYRRLEMATYFFLRRG